MDAVMVAEVSPALTADAVLLKGSPSRPGEAVVLLMKRANAPFARAWAIPGGFVEVGESVEAACRRELVEETGLLGRIVALLGEYSTPGRDPRGSTVTVAYILAVSGVVPGVTDDEALDTAWFPLDALPRDLAFDHAEVLADARAWFTEHGLAPLGDSDVEVCM